MFLAAVTLISTVIRFYHLGNIPNGLATDEADIGYNAYSILKTGADVYGRKFPLFFQSLDDYKPGLVFYLTIPAIKAFGLNDFSVRLAPAIFGIFTPALAFILIKLLYPKNGTLPYLTAILITFAPWNIALSRAMIQYIPIIFLYLLSLILFLYAQTKNLRAPIKATTLFLSSILLALTLYVYYAAIIYLPFIVIILGYLYRGFIKKNFKFFFTSVLILIILSLPALNHYSKRESKSRLNDISVLTADITLPVSIEEMKHDQSAGDQTAAIIHNRRFVYLVALLDNYFDYFNPDYLFINASNTRYFYVYYIGLFYLIELPFVLYCLFILIQRREKSDLLLLGLFMVGPIPAAITLGSPLPHRGLLLIMIIQIFSAIGISTFLQNFKSKVSRKGLALYSVMIAIYALSIYFFLHQYFIHAPREFVLGGWFPVVRDAIPLVNRNAENYKRVVFSWSAQRIVPPIYYLFYNQIDPKIIQEKAAKWGNDPVSYRQIYDEIGKVEFRPINWENDKNLKNTLFVGNPKEFGQDANVIDRTYLPNGQEHFLLVDSVK